MSVSGGLERERRRFGEVEGNWVADEIEEEEEEAIELGIHLN